MCDDEHGQCECYKAGIGDSKNALEALAILQSYNCIHNDLESYLFEIAEWGLGRRETKPDYSKYGLGAKELTHV